MADGGRVALVTGAAGFIGSHLVDRLVDRGWGVRCLVRRTSRLRWLPTQRIELRHADLSTATIEELAPSLAGVSVVFHLAAVTSARTDAEYERVNVDGTRRLVQSVARAAPHARIVFCSSLAASGPSGAGRPAREGDPPRPIGAYGRSKLAAERIVAASGLRHVAIRPPTVYGPRDVDLLSAFRLAQRGIAVRTAPPGQRLSMVHAADVASGLIAAAERDATGIYYVSDGIIHAWEEIIEALAAAVGRPVRIVPFPRSLLTLAAHADRARARVAGRKPLLTPDRARDLVQAAWTCDDSRARQELGYASRVSLASGLRETADWYRNVGWL